MPAVTTQGQKVCTLGEECGSMYVFRGQSIFTELEQWLQSFPNQTIYCVCLHVCVSTHAAAVRNIPPIHSSCLPASFIQY